MAFLFPKLFPGCVTTGGFGVNLTLTNAMALYWKPVGMQLQATCTELDSGQTFSINQTITNGQTLDDLVCGSSVAYGGAGIEAFDVGPNAFKQDEFYMPRFLMQFILRDQGDAGRICVADTSIDYSHNGNISFLDGFIPVLFFDDDDPGQPFEGSGSLTILSERTFER
jgi:hypothetical protein